MRGVPGPAPSPPSACRTSEPLRSPFPNLGLPLVSVICDCIYGTADALLEAPLALPGSPRLFFWVFIPLRVPRCPLPAARSELRKPRKCKPRFIGCRTGINAAFSLFIFFFFSERICIRRVRARVFSLGLNTVWARNAEPRAGVHNFRTIRGLVRFLQRVFKARNLAGGANRAPERAPRAWGGAARWGGGSPRPQPPRGRCCCICASISQFWWQLRGARAAHLP